ncbi:MAG TPA: tetratricopeptide repeat protein [Planctomycetaceae bacterium]|jgi:protein O-GlcNAc transferase|nr:tetratricopeptide repeat protein [Planctomycetaceae bacterium]
MSKREICDTFEQGLALHRAGRVDDAERLYRQVLRDQSNHAGAMHLLGVVALGSNRSLEALDWVERAIAVAPGNAIFRISQGQALTAQRRLDDAIDAYRRATDLAPDLVEAWFALGIALQSAGRRREAVAAYERVLDLQPDHADASNNLGSAWDQLGELEQAIAVYRKALKREPERATTLNNLGSALSRCGRVEEAVAVCRRAIELEPDFAAAHNNLGLALTSSRRLDEAVDVLHQAVDLRPDFAEAWYNLANALNKRADFNEATAAYRRALNLRADWAEAHINLGNTLQARSEFEAAVDSYQRALTLEPDHVDALNNLGSAQRDLGRVDEAIAAFHRCIALRPGFHVAHCNLGNVLRDSGQIEEAVDAYRRAVVLCPTDTISHSNLAYAVHFHPRYDGAAILGENLGWHAAHAAGLRGESARHLNDRDPDRRLRIGYVGADFRDHCQSLFTIPLLSRHDHEQFEIVCYANLTRPDAVTQRIRQYADRWRVIAGRSDADVADDIRADQVDILVDLTMHMSNGRPLLFARRPAPVQVAYLAYPGTTGLAEVDYRLTDPYLDLPGESDCDYAEKSLRLPETFWCYDPLTDVPSPGPLPATAAGHITFGCLNNFSKVNATTLQLWSGVLRTVADSRLLLLSPRGGHRARVLGRFRHAGIDSDRIEFAEYLPRPQYLELYRRIDLGLDTVPYNGHTTSLDSFWMGVPVVTRVGRTAVGRAGWSQLSNLALTELAAWNDDDFVTIASGLAHDLRRLTQLRATLRDRMQASPLMDAPRFVRHVEAAYRVIWREWCQRD